MQVKLIDKGCNYEKVIFLINQLKTYQQTSHCAEIYEKTYEPLGFIFGVYFGDRLVAIRGIKMDLEKAVCTFCSVEHQYKGLGIQRILIAACETHVKRSIKELDMEEYKLSTGARVSNIGCHRNFQQFSYTPIKSTIYADGEQGISYQKIIKP